MLMIYMILRVTIPAASLPLLGSVRQYDESISMVFNLGKYFSFYSLVPYL